MKSAGILLLLFLALAISAFFGIRSVRGIDNPRTENLADVVTKAQTGTTGNYGIYIKNLKNGETYTSNEHRSFPTASLYKLWVMGETYNQVHDGVLKESQMLEEDVEQLHETFGLTNDVAEQKTGRVMYTVEDALERMITVSDNYASLLLAKNVGLANISDFMKDNKLSESKTGQPPHTTAVDIGTLFEKIYKGDVINRQYSNKMLDLLKKQEINDRIPKYLPDETTVAHKTGELDGLRHDAGIVYTDEGDYIIVVLSESDDPNAAAERIATLSKAVYDYFQK